jgi:hypothetical protein
MPLVVCDFFVEIGFGGFCSLVMDFLILGCGWRERRGGWCILCIGWDPFCHILAAERFEVSRDRFFVCFSFGALVCGYDGGWRRRVGSMDWMMRLGGNLCILLEVDELRTLKTSLRYYLLWCLLVVTARGRWT